MSSPKDRQERWQNGARRHFSGISGQTTFYYVVHPGKDRMVGLIPNFGWYELVEHDIDHPGIVLMTSIEEARRVASMFEGCEVRRFPKQLTRH